MSNKYGIELIYSFRRCQIDVYKDDRLLFSVHEEDLPDGITELDNPQILTFIETEYVDVLEDMLS